MREIAIYKDINQFDPTTSPYRTDVRAVFQSILNIIRIQKTEIPFSTIGASLEDELFELYNIGNKDIIISDIAEAVRSVDQRVTIDLQSSDIQIIEQDNRMNIILVFSVDRIEGQIFQLIEPIG
jgi:hypothetical protein